MSAINSIDGKIFTKYSNDYFKQTDTIEFIKELIAQNKSKSICLFWDNASVHIGKEIKEYTSSVEGLKII